MGNQHSHHKESSTSLDTLVESSSSESGSDSLCWTPFVSNDYYTDEELNMQEESTFESNFQRFRPIYIVTTSSLPWFTGTSINPLLRAAYILRYQQKFFQQNHVTLVLPWLFEAQDRINLYGKEWEDKTPQDQEDFLRKWLSEAAKLQEESLQLEIQWYSAKYHPQLHSIFAMGDIIQDLDPLQDAICILEEPEHLNFYKASGQVSWRHKFHHVVGIIHTNYKAYAASKSIVAVPIVSLASSLFVRAYCDRVIKLSDVLQNYAVEKEVVCNVHGIRQDFLDAPGPKGGIYFVGKLLWAKGLDRLLDLQMYYKKETKQFFPMHVYGSGPEEQEIIKCYQGKSIFYNQEMPVEFLGRKDHASLVEYKIFVNPSVTEVLCTTTAEAIAMGKFAIIPNHPSNTFFEQFPNCLMYNDRKEFVKHLQYAIENDPEPLSQDLAYILTWEAATERLFEVGCISQRDSARRRRLEGNRDDQIAQFHNELFKGHTGDVLRKVFGAGPVAAQFKYEIERQLSNTVKC